MKLHFVVLLALLASQGFAQAAPVQNESGAAAAANSKPVAPGHAVITVDGVCKAPDAKTGECKTVITRTEFERLVAVLSRNGQDQQAIPPQAKRQLAIQYSRLMLFADLAEKEGLQNSPEGEELIRFVRLQALTEELARTLQQKAVTTSEEVKNYYDHNLDRYTEWNLQRIVVPLSTVESQAKQEELKQLAEEFRKRASNGANFDALQNEAFEKAGIKDPPSAKLVLKPGASLPETHSVVYRLKPGEMSNVIEDRTGFYIYKLESSNVVPLDQNKAAIEGLLAGQKAQEAIRKLTESNKVHLNSNYFESEHQDFAPTTSSARPMGDATQAGIRQAQ